MSSTPNPVETDPRSTNRFIRGVTTASTAFVDVFAAGPIDTPVRVTSLLDFERTFGGLDEESEASFAILQFFRNGGQTAWVVRAEDGASAEALVRALGSLEQIEPERWNLLSMPGSVDLPEDEALAAIRGALEICAAKGAFMIVDVPRKVDRPEKMEKWAARLPDDWADQAAVYFPRLVIEDPLEGDRHRDVAASGTLAGIYARTDQHFGVWTAPAGKDAVLMGADVAVEVGDAWTQRLGTRGVNVLRRVTARGVVSWGARTLAVAGEWRYVNVRRLADYIEQSLYQGLAWTAAERNGPRLWEEIRREVSVFLEGLHGAGAFQGRAAEDAYFVRCDPTTTTAEDVENGVVNVLVGFAPVQPAEFVFLRIQEKTQPIRTST